MSINTGRNRRNHAFANIYCSCDVLLLRTVACHDATLPPVGEDGGRRWAPTEDVGQVGMLMDVEYIDLQRPPPAKIQRLIAMIFFI